jgi:ABC-type multidrug transport system fused ATPase/permease subunit
VTVFQNILREFRDKTIIATIHQLDLLPMFDRICVFDKGKVVGVGTMDELRVKCPQFLSLMEAMEKSSLDNIPETSNV